MNVAALAEELGLEPTALLRMCRDRGIRASWEQSELSDESVAVLREAIRPDDPEHPAEPAAVGANPAVVASFDHLPAAPGVDSRPVPAGAGDPEAPEATSPVGPAEVSAAAEPAPEPAAPAFGSIDARYASVARSAPEVIGDVKPIRPPYGPEVGSGVRTLVVAIIFGAAWVLARLLPHWRQGRWWLVPIVAAVVGGLAALRALFLGVGGFGSSTRYSTSRRGRPILVAITVVAAALLLGGTLLGFYDWTAINVPGAYTRLRHSVSSAQDTTSNQLDQLRATDLSNTIDPEGANITGLSVGDCIEVTLGDELNSDTVPCTSTHRYEVVGFSSLGQSSYPGTKAEAALATESCSGPFESYVGVAPSASKFAMLSTYPSAIQWQNGARRGACLAVAGSDRNTSVHGVGQ